MILTRDISTPNFTLGKLSLPDAGYFSVEPPWKNNAPDISCIPTGKYQIIISYSPHFGRAMPHIIGVENRDGILIHDGSSVVNTEGCIVIGMQRTSNGVGLSKMAFDDFYPRLQAELAKGPTWIVIT